MYQKFTQQKSEDYLHVMNEDENHDSFVPTKKTLSFISQFARTYHVEKGLPLSMSGIILN